MKTNAIISALCVVGIIGALCSNGEEQRSVVEPRPGTIPVQKVVYWSDVPGMKWDWGTQVTNSPFALHTTGFPYVEVPIGFAATDSGVGYAVPSSASFAGAKVHGVESLGAGDGIITNCYGGIGLGMAFNVTNDVAFVWSGRDYNGAIKYGSHGMSTFNVDPHDGPAGFWIGETNLATYLANAGGGVSSFAVGRNGTPYTGDVELVLTHADPNVTVTTNFSSGIKIGSLNYTHGFAELDLFNKGDPNANVDWNHSPIITDIYIPGNVSAFNNDAGYVTASHTHSNLVNGSTEIVANANGTGSIVRQTYTTETRITGINFTDDFDAYWQAGEDTMIHIYKDVAANQIVYVERDRTVRHNLPLSLRRATPEEGEQHIAWIQVGYSADQLMDCWFCATGGSGQFMSPNAGVSFPLTSGEYTSASSGAGYSFDHGTGSIWGGSIGDVEVPAGSVSETIATTAQIPIDYVSASTATNIAKQIIRNAVSGVNTNIQSAEDARAALTNLITILKNL